MSVKLLAAVAVVVSLTFALETYRRTATARQMVKQDAAEYVYPVYKERVIQELPEATEAEESAAKDMLRDAMRADVKQRPWLLTCVAQKYPMTAAGKRAFAQLANK